jgi:hypothetical protein
VAEQHAVGPVVHRCEHRRLETLGAAGSNPFRHFAAIRFALHEPEVVSQNCTGNFRRIDEAKLECHRLSFTGMKL